MNDPIENPSATAHDDPDPEQSLESTGAVTTTAPEGERPSAHGSSCPPLSSRSAGNRSAGLLRLRTRLVAEPFTDEASDESAESTLPSTSGGLVTGLMVIATISWTVAATLWTGADTTAAVLLTIAALLILLITPSTIRPGKGLGRSQIGARPAAVHYTAFAAASLLAWSSLLWLPDLTWAVVAVVAVLQTGYALGVALLAVEHHLDEQMFGWREDSRPD